MKSKQNEQHFLKCLSKGLKASLFALFFLISSVISAQTDFLEIPSITLDGQVYELKWSAHARQKVVQEYLLPNETITRYSTKIILEYIPDRTVESVANARFSDLVDGKEAGRVINFRQLESEDEDSEEIMLEFMVGSMMADGETRNAAEWNVYRYIPGQEGVIVLAMSRRAYGEESIRAFLQEINQNRENWINSVAENRLQ